jgi:uncharacterized membrane protein YjdF
MPNLAGGGSPIGTDLITSRPHLVVAGLASVLIIAIALTAKLPGYRLSPLFLLPVVWLAYGFRERLALSVPLFALFSGAVLLHDLGAYGFYQDSPVPFSWDILVHFVFGLAGGLIVRQSLAQHWAGTFRAWQLAATTVLFLMGLGALHEIMEYGTYLTLGEQRGMLKTTSYFFDTQRDLTNNLLGCLTGLVLRAIARLIAG